MHSYVVAGAYTATLRVRDSRFAFSSALSFSIKAGNALPVPQIQSPTPLALFSVGQSVTLSGAASDAEDGVLPGTGLSWRVIVHHDTHTHPFVGPLIGANVQFTAPAPEDLLAATNSYLEIELTATDSQGATASVSQNMQPQKISLTFATTPAGLGLRLFGQPIADGQVVTSWKGWGLLAQALPQRPAMQNFYFSSWSDAGASAHIITTPAAATTYTATFATVPPASADADANGEYDPLFDGLLILRHMFGLSGSTLIAGALGPNALHDTAGAVVGFLDGIGLALDIDADGKVDPLTDGLLLLRFLSGLRGQQLTQGVVASGAMRDSLAIETYLTSLIR
ncbi:MAG: hypothetical protein ABI854_01080 [Betaproteobacteria bacterium]